MTAKATTPVNIRFPNSIIPWYSRSDTNWSSSQFGQSEQPRPEPVRRTLAPVITMIVNDHRAARVRER
jgi:hypothetical protein